MILQSIEIENFGVFRGKHTFNLTPDLHNEKPIILFGGLNGSGKTTLFDGIKLCLYGKQAFKELRTKKDYNSFLSKKIKPLSPIRKKKYVGAIEINIEFNDFGVKDTYSVRRNWDVDDDNVEETFRVLKNRQMLGTIENEYSQAFVANLIPMGISNLFFFDGEKIQELAQDTINNGFFKEALDSILGLDIIQTLIKDLKTYAHKQNTSIDGQEIIENIETINQEIDQLEQEIVNQRQDRASINTKLEKTIYDITKKENELTLQGAGYAKKRYEFQDKLNKIETEIIETQSRLREHYSGLFPFTLVPQLCLQLRDRIQDENNRKRELSTFKLIEERRNEFTKRLFQKNGHLTQFSEAAPKEDIVNDILSTLLDVIKESDTGDFFFINDFSEKELDQLLYWVDQIINTLPREMKILSDRYNDLLKDQAHYENLLRMAPDDSILDPLVNEINSMYKARGGYENQLMKIEENLHSLEYKKTDLERRLKLQQEKFEQYNKFERKIVLIKKIRSMLDEYQEAIRENKIEMLRNSFLDSITMIIRKHNFITDITIDPDYQIELQREDGNYISKSILSNGEKQIFAISMLLALAKVSGRPLPFVIDTPLARLDSSHRDNIVENFFPNASHQVIIFSTDTEIDKIYFEKLAPYVTRVYHLQFDDQTASSTGVEGYFWKQAEATQD